MYRAEGCLGSAATFDRIAIPKEHSIDRKHLGHQAEPTVLAPIELLETS
jgi:hypothetical protein